MHPASPPYTYKENIMSGNSSSSTKTNGIGCLGFLWVILQAGFILLYVAGMWPEGWETWWVAVPSIVALGWTVFVLVAIGLGALAYLVTKELSSTGWAILVTAVVELWFVSQVVLVVLMVLGIAAGTIVWLPSIIVGLVILTAIVAVMIAAIVYAVTKKDE